MLFFPYFFHLLSVPAEEYGPLMPEEVINQVTRKHGKKTILWTADLEGWQTRTQLLLYVCAVINSLVSSQCIKGRKEGKRSQAPLRMLNK